MSEWKRVFDANISLYVRIIVEHLLNNGWQMISIYDYTKNMPSFSCMDALKTNDYQKEGLFPIVSQSKDLISGYTDNKQLVNKIDSPIIIFGDHTQVVKYIDFDFVLGADGTKILTVSKDYLPKFLYYIIKSIDLHSNKYARHYSKLRKEKIPYCKDSINIQEKIADFLDSLAENAIEEKNFFDKKIESKIISLQKECLKICLIEKENKKQKSFAKQLRKNILQEAIDGKLTADWRKQHPVQKGNPDYDAEALFEQIQTEKYHTDLFAPNGAHAKKTKSVSSEPIRVTRKEKTLPPITEDEIPFEIPTGWKWVRLGEIVENITSGSREWAKYYSDTGAIFLRMGNLSRESYELRMDNIQHVRVPESSEGKRTRLLPFDLLFSITAEIGNLGLIPKDFPEAYINQHTARIRFVQFVKQSLYFANALLAPGIRKLYLPNAHGMKNSFRLDTLSFIPIPLPPLAEQKEIVARVEQHLQTITLLETQITTRETTTKQLMQSILKDAFEE